MKLKKGIDKKKLILLHQENNKSFYLYNPTPFRLLYRHFEKMTISRRVRLLLEYFAKGRYKVFYLTVNDELVGHCVVAYGNRRLKCSSAEDIVIGPYYVESQFRGLGYAKDMIRLTLSYGKLRYRYAYDYINKNNLPSINATLACEFEKCGELDIVGVFHRLVECSNGEYNVYRRINDKYTGVN